MISKKRVNPLILALDVEPNEAKNVIRELSPHVEIFKIGSRLFTALGPQIVSWVHQHKRKVFLDLKFHDIPLTVAEACRNAVKMKVWGFTVHTMGGLTMMREAVRIVREESKRIHITKPLIFGVTVLTSLEQKDLKEIGILQAPILQVKRLAFLAKKSGLDGVVASGNEIKMIKQSCGQNFLVVVPGIRLGNRFRQDDQKRVWGPRDAVKLGADYLVIGRPILQSENRVRTIKELLGGIC